MAGMMGGAPAPMAPAARGPMAPTPTGPMNPVQPGMGIGGAPHPATQPMIPTAMRPRPVYRGGM